MVEEAAEGAAKGAIDAAAAGGPNTILLLALVLGAVITVILGRELIKAFSSRSLSESPGGPSGCTPPGGCAEVNKVGVQVENLIRQIEADRQERREFRQETRDSTLRIHDRLDVMVTRDELSHLTEIIGHFQEETSHIVNMISARAGDLTGLPSNPPTKRNAA